MPRVGNKKSRKGCIRCKTRKVKCDEVRPQCGWCQDHVLVCEYPSVNERHFALSESVKKSPQSLSLVEKADDVGLYPTAIVDRRSLELGLMQYYVTNVAPTFPSEDKERWLILQAECIPQESLRNQNLLDTLFAYALLHMHIQILRAGVFPRNSGFYEEQGIRLDLSSSGVRNSKIGLLALHRQYLDQALRGQRAVLASIDKSNADGICITAIWLAMISLVHSAQSMPGEDYQLPIEWFVLQGSVGSCLEISRSMLTMDSATSVIIHASPGIDNRNLDFRKFSIFRSILEWQPLPPEVMSGEDLLAYETGLAYIQTIYKRIAQGDSLKMLGRRILAFPNSAHAHFATLLEQGRSRALVMLAHLLAMSKRLEAEWWIFQNVADYHVHGMISLVPTEWRWAMKWPSDVLSSGTSLQYFVWPPNE